MRLLDQYGVLRPGLALDDAADQAGALLHLNGMLLLLDRWWDLDRIESWMSGSLVRMLTTLEPPSEASGSPAPEGRGDEA